MASQDPQNELYSPTKAAKILGLNPRLLTELCDSGELEYCQPYGAKRFVTLEEVRRWLRTKTTPRRDCNQAERVAERERESVTASAKEL